MNSRLDEISNAKEQIRLRADIASVVGRYVTLKPFGQTMKGLCPFHNEKTPSFNVNPAKGFFYCFGCGRGGDVFRFVQDIEGVDFFEALTMLAEETGVRFEAARRGGSNRYDDGYGARSDEPLPSRQQTKSAKTELLAMHDEAAKFFYQCVKKHPQAVDYFKSRELRPETVREFGLGYAPAGWSALYEHLLAKKFPSAQIVQSGLVVAKEGGGIYDRFRDRVIFPLADLSGRVVGFAGRGLEAAALPKYINSPETALYQKSRILYGLHKARQSVRERGEILIVEGYMDCLSLYQAGIANAVAVSGTAFTEDHAHLIKRFAQKVVFVFDGDRAGLAAARRAALVLAPLGLQASILTLPAGDDPDTFVRREGAGAFTELLPLAKSAEDFLIDAAVSEHGDSSHGKSRAAEELAPYVRALSDPIVRAGFIDSLARRLRVAKHHIIEKLNKADDYRQSNDYAPSPIVAAAFDRDVLGPLEKSFLRILLMRPELIAVARQHISPEILTDPLSANIYSTMLDAYDREGGFGGLYDAVGDSEAGRAISMLAVDGERMENIEDEFVLKVTRLRRKFIKAQMAVLTEELGRCHESEKGRFLEEIKKYGELLKELN